jgi:endonuclease/exonuclease/phosphatase family metal-dependent hydrolase
MRRLSVVVVLAMGMGTSPALALGGNEPDDLRVVNFNVLHGAICPEGSEACQLPDRMELLSRRLIDAQCPEVVGLQETSTLVFDTLKKLAFVEECDYQVVFKRPKSIDQEVVFTSLPVGKTKVMKLFAGFRTASRVQLDSDLGPVVLVVTHQDGDPAPGESGADAVCNERCPDRCEVGTPLLACQTTLAAHLADSGGPKNAIRILMGDFNVTPASARYASLIGDGWVDSHLAAGNPECDPSGVGCTSGRRDNLVDDLKDPNSKQLERIDFVFVKTPPRCSPMFDPDLDGDGDGLGTGIWDDPVTDGPGGMVFVSDHSATSVDLSCEES